MSKRDPYTMDNVELVQELVRAAERTGATSFGEEPGLRATRKMVNWLSGALHARLLGLQPPFKVDDVVRPVVTPIPPEIGDITLTEEHATYVVRQVWFNPRGRDDSTGSVGQVWYVQFKVAYNTTLYLAKSFEKTPAK